MKSDPQTEQATAGVKFTKFEVATDGTAKGTSIKINGKEVADLASLYFSWYGGTYSPLSLSYTTREKGVPGEMAASTSYSLRCPEPTYAANKAEASIADPGQMFFEFAKVEVDPVATKIEIERGRRTNPWAQL